MICLLVLIVIVVEKHKSYLTKKIKGKYHLTIMLKDIFGFAQHQEKGTHGLGYNII